MTIEDLLRHFIEASISGASKTQIIRKFKETYNLNDNQIKKLELSGYFKRSALYKKEVIEMSNQYKKDIINIKKLCPIKDGELLKNTGMKT